jgi:hypothetical protein
LRDGRCNLLFASVQGADPRGLGLQVMAAHVMDFEHWTYRYLMKQGKLCVYGE